jgi:glycosyltransferase involved in cell wall biosynthesis
VRRALVVLLGPSREAISGVTTHLNALLGSRLATRFDLVHFQVGNEGRSESFVLRSARLALSPLLLAATLLRTGAALLHINTSFNAKALWRDLAYVLVGKLCGARVLCQVHGGDLERYTAGPGVLASLVRASLRLADALVVLSREELEALRARLPGQAVEVVPNGVDCAPDVRYHRPAPESGGPLRLIYIGRLAPAKGLLETIEALRVARARGVAARLVLAGSGAEEPRLRQYVRDAGLAREVAFVGRAYGSHKAELLAQADVLTLASYSEGMPYSLLEAMAAGVVPIVTPVGAIPDVVNEGEHGLFVAPRDAEALADAIARLAGDRAMLARMSAACRARIAAAYSLERMARDFSQIYAGLCATRTPRTA